jgi:acetyl-CoA C-acetyltransferase
MTFAGGPFNNFTLQGLSQLTKQVRITDTTGIITSISGMLTKQGLISLSSQEPPSEIHISDITDTTRSKTETVEIQPNVTGEVEIISSTVSFNAGNAKAYVLVENRNGQRRLLVSKKEGLIDHFLNMHRIEDRISISKNGEMTI